jgi:TatD DNase family protein
MLWAAGLHPWWVKDYLANHTVDDLSQALIINMQDKKCVALGETGLDAIIDLDLSIQVTCLEVHIKLAQQFSKPLILHSRKTHAELISILKKVQLNPTGVVHAFSGSYEQAKAFIDAGLYLGIGGVITYERANKTREAVKKIPLEYLLLETDAPDMPLQGQQGEINSPINVVSIANHLAELKQEPLDHIARITTENAHRLFGITHAV